jgi:TRAP-type C4-dicarboxylate transport system permease small subunit
MSDIVDPVITPVHGPRPLALWTPVIGPMVATLAALEAAYALVGPACRRETTLFVHLVPALMLVATILMTMGAVRLWRGHGRAWETDATGVDSRTRFLAIMGMMSGATGALIIVAQWLAIFFHYPCAGS